MTKKSLRILILEDVYTEAEIIKRTLQKSGIDMETKHVETEKAFIEGIKSFTPDIILSDYNLPGYTGMDALGHALKVIPDIPFIIVTGSINEETAAGCIRAGAWDYVIKEHLERLPQAVSEALILKQSRDDHKRTEEMRLELEEKYRSIVETSPDAITVSDLKGNLTFVSRQTLKMYGYEHEDDLLGRKALEFVIKEDFDRALKDIQMTLQEGICKDIEFTMVKKDGTSFPVEVTAVVLKDQVRGPTGFITVIRDISERKHAEESLQASEVRYRFLFDNAPDAYYINDLKGTFIDGNIAAEKLMGYNKSELIGRSFLKLNILPKNQIPKAAKLLALNAIGKSTGPDEFTIIRNDGSKLEAEIRTHSGKIGGQTRVLGIARDITDRIQKQKELEIALDKANRADRLKTLFLANMSHEIRTPLNSILGFTDLIQQELDKKLDDSQKKYFHIIQNSGERLMHTVHDILDISMIETGTLDFDPSRFPLSNMVQEVVKEFDPTAKVKGLELNISLLKGNTVVFSDRYQIQKAISNLIDNAIKYTERGKVDITLKEKND
ncbi:MAG: PAS domain S-box protein, partial [Candidatus Neomarinimicrobiota bacterium]